MAERLSVFWTRIDNQPNKTILDKNREKLVKEWAKYGIPDHRIVQGTAGGHLVLRGYPIEEVGDKAEVLRKMRLLTELNDEDALKKAPVSMNCNRKFSIIWIMNAPRY